MTEIRERIAGLFFAFKGMPATIADPELGAIASPTSARSWSFPRRRHSFALLAALRVEASARSASHTNTDQGLAAARKPAETDIEMARLTIIRHA